MKTYIIERVKNSGNGLETLKLEVPDEWKVTFGPVVVPRGGPRQNTYGQGQMPWALRFYESENRQRAIFMNVVNFIDQSINVEKLTHETVDGVEMPEWREYINMMPAELPDDGIPVETVGTDFTEILAPTRREGGFINEEVTFNE